MIILGISIVMVTAINTTMITQDTITVMVVIIMITTTAISRVIKKF